MIELIKIRNVYFSLTSHAEFQQDLYIEAEDLSADRAHTTFWRAPRYTEGTPRIIIA